jgi:hypothetical protein
MRKRVVNVEYVRARSFPHFLRGVGEEWSDEVRKALRKLLGLCGFSDRDNHVGAKQLDDSFRLLSAVYHHDWIETSAPRCVSEPDRIAKGFTIAGVNRPGNP